jgi:hypothetical protein
LDIFRDAKLWTVGSDGVGNGICVTTIGSWDIRGGGLYQIFLEFLGELDFSVFYAALAYNKTKKSTSQKKC